MVGATKDVARKVQRDKLMDWAKVMTYQSIFALFPMLLIGVSILGFVGQGQLYEDMLAKVREVAPESLVQPIEDFLSSATTAGGASIALALSLLVALNAASGALGAAGTSLNVVLGVQEERGLVRRKATSIGWTLVLIVLIALALMMVFLGGPLAGWAFDQIGVGGTAVTAWTFIRWPLAAVVLMLAWAIIYRFAPDGDERSFRFISPGAVIGVVLWLAASLAFFFYVSNFGSYNRTYGAFATAIILLLWLWISNLALLLGAAINAVIDERACGISHAPEGTEAARARAGKGADAGPAAADRAADGPDRDDRRAPAPATPRERAAARGGASPPAQPVGSSAPPRRAGLAGGLALAALAFLALLPARRGKDSKR